MECLQERDYDYMPEIYVADYYQVWDNDEWVVVTHEQYFAFKGRKRFVPASEQSALGYEYLGNCLCTYI